ncbi:hypothetical protein KP509_34G006300 [Ceratopteris richardii]|nr:hypothetical protein KP509_34G006300 [Ceratopteris richardii]
MLQDWRTNHSLQHSTSLMQGLLSRSDWMCFDAMELGVSVGWGVVTTPLRGIVSKCPTTICRSCWTCLTLVYVRPLFCINQIFLVKRPDRIGDL